MWRNILRSSTQKKVVLAAAPNQAQGIENDIQRSSGEMVISGVDREGDIFIRCMAG